MNLEVTSVDDNQNEESRDITETAQVQIVHNSPYPVVDVYVDGALALENVPYRASTGLVDLPVNTEVGIAPAETDSAFALVLTTPNGDVVTLPATETALSVNNDNFVNISKDYIIHQNYPNPFNPTTSIQYELLTDSKLNITIFDMLGNVVDELYDGFQTSGNKSIKWDARNSSGELVSAGMYFYKIQVGNSSQVKRMMFLK